MTKTEVSQYSPLALAFLGDAVYEQLVREKLLIRANMPAGKLHKLAVKYVCCEFQSAAVDRIFDRLSEDEQAIYKRGRNADGITSPKHAAVTEYRRATGLECLFGYLNLMGEDARVREIFEMVWETGEKFHKP